jgi:hypothetical protein
VPLVYFFIKILKKNFEKKKKNLPQNTRQIQWIWIFFCLGVLGVQNQFRTGHQKTCSRLAQFENNYSYPKIFKNRIGMLKI